MTGGIINIIDEKTHGRQMVLSAVNSLKDKKLKKAVPLLHLTGNFKV